MKKVKRYSGVLIKNNAEVLLCKRNNVDTNPGVWSIPAGKLNDDESPGLGAKREFFEETNIKLDNNLKLCGFATRKTRDNSKDKGLLYVFLYETDEKLIPDLKNAKDGTEHTECNYFSLKELPIQDQSDQLFVLIKNILSKH